MQYYLSKMALKNTKLISSPITQEQFGEAIDLLESNTINLPILTRTFEKLVLNPGSSPKQVKFHIKIKSKLFT